jgi:hypothetical protein
MKESGFNVKQNQPKDAITGVNTSGLAVKGKAGFRLKNTPTPRILAYGEFLALMG